MIAPSNLTLIRKVWSNVDEHDYTEIKAAHLHEIERILNLAREEGRQEVRSKKKALRNMLRNVG